MDRTVRTYVRILLDRLQKAMHVCHCMTFHIYTIIKISYDFFKIVDYQII
jgi:hypothetical protein